MRRCAQGMWWETIWRSGAINKLIYSSNNFLFNYDGLLIENILHEISKRKANCIGHILCRNCLLQRVIEGKIKGGIRVTGRRGSRRRKLLDNLKERRGYSHLKEEALDRTMWRARFGRGFGPVVRQTSKWMKLHPLVKIEKYMLLLILTDSGVNLYIYMIFETVFWNRLKKCAIFPLVFNRFSLVPVLQSTKRYPKNCVFAEKRFL